MRMNYVAN